nr:ATP-binding protein [Methanobrevibacter arboriphilus]
MQSLRNEISKLIESQKEGTYWDFKCEPHVNKADLLHDILCLANCNYDGDRYLILGVKDPKNNCKVIGLENNQPNRKDQTDLLDFLQTKRFAGDNIPEIELITIEIKNRDIDVIVIKNKNLKPYYLTNDYRDKSENVRAHYIYTRNRDKNTSKDKSANINDIEIMWKQRFGLDLDDTIHLGSDDFLVLETLEKVTENEYLNFKINISSLNKLLDEHSLSEEKISDSLDILQEKGFITIEATAITKYIKLTKEGLIAIFKHEKTYNNYVKEISSAIINEGLTSHQDIFTQKKLPMLVVEVILEDFNDKNYIILNRVLIREYFLSKNFTITGIGKRYFKELLS